MKKLLKLKDWLLVPDAARHLSDQLEEDVGEADVLRLALDGHLTLSVNFQSDPTANRGKFTPLQDAERRSMPGLDGEKVELFNGVNLGDGRVLELAKGIVRLVGVWDLAMLGSERFDVERRYSTLTETPGIDEDVCSDHGTIVSKDGVVCRLVSHFKDNDFFDNKNLKEPFHHPANYYPAGGLPDDSVFVVRTAALHDLEARLSEAEKPIIKPTERILGNRERTTLLVIIAALAKLPKIDVTHPSKAAEAIESETALMGARVAKRTIENHLKRIPDAIESKSQN